MTDVIMVKQLWLFSFWLVMYSYSLRAQEVSSLPLLLNLNYSLSNEQREAAMQEVVTKGAYHDWGLQLSNILTTDYQSGNVDQKPWIARLRLAQIFDWLNTNELDYTGKWLAVWCLANHVPLKKEVLVEGLKNPEFRHRLIELMGDETNLPKDDLLFKRLKPETLVALLRQPELMDILGQTVTASNYLPGVWRVLADLQESFPDKIGDYPALAVALAVVFDRAFPPSWPHRQVKRSAIPFVWQNWKPLFAYFTQMEEDGALLTDIRNLRADQLKFLVDAPVDVRELEWANKKVMVERNSFARIFQTIEYSMARIQQGAFDWPSSSYQLSEIKQNGGICVDQAYYSMMVGKAKGLPTLLFTGQGLNGGHAWFGFLIEDNKWDMDAGRYKSQNFVSGTVYDPQKWQTISDHELAFLSDPGDSETIYNYSRNLTILAQLPPVRADPVKRKALLNAALEVNPRLPMVWEAVEAVLKENGTTEDLIQHYTRMVDQFSGQDDVKITALRRLYLLQSQSGSQEELEQTRAAMLACRSDLAIRAAADLVHEKVVAGKSDDALQMYEQLLPMFNKEGGGNLFYNFVVPVVISLQESKHHDLAVQALGEADRLFPTSGANDNPTGTIQIDLAQLHGYLSKE